jgi:hypothetical protein
MTKELLEAELRRADIGAANAAPAFLEAKMQEIEQQLETIALEASMPPKTKSIKTLKDIAGNE